MKSNLLGQLRSGEKLSFRSQLLLTIQLSIPAIMAQLSAIVMQYIDASMVGRLGANDSASIGLVASSTWLMGGLCSAASIGFTVQVAQFIGAGKEKEARGIVRQGLVAVLIFSTLLLMAGVAISAALPVWLGGKDEITQNASVYFMIFSCYLPIHQLNTAAGGMLQCSGNMKVPSILHVIMCGLDVVFNAVLIFPSQMIAVAGFSIWIPGAGLGVMGAALGTALAEAVIMLFMLSFLLVRSSTLHLRRSEKLHFSIAELKRAGKIAVPVGFEQVIMCGAQIMATRIVSPLGTIAIAANSFSVTAESLCYMPGYGIGTAATTLIGQGIGAKRQDLTKRLGWLTTLLGMVVMAVSGGLMYVFAPQMIGMISPDPEIRALGTEILRIEAFAEPMYAASIVASGVFRGAGDTFVPSCLNFCSMWFVRIPLSAFLAPRMGLRGVWIAMCIELCVRGVLFLVRLSGKRWMHENTKEKSISDFH
ncbi:MAG: MATE family efflux transporter [Lachnospiraceae bacterium]|nr:MATE family efflux transporter [Lachnospiraceae bacterium]